MDAVAGGGLGEAGDWDRGDKSGGVGVVIGGDMCVCSLLCVPAYPLVRAHVVCAYGMAFLVAGKSFLHVAMHVRTLFGPAQEQ
jgi:hypothetical protein